MHDAVIFTSRFCIFAAVHSLLALPTIKKAIIRQSQSRQWVYRLTYNLISLAMFGWVMASYRNTPVLYVAPGVWSLVMYLVQGAALLMLIFCVRQTGAADFLGLPGKSYATPAGNRLVTGGCYRIVRHPLYLFSMLFLLFNPVVTCRWLILSALSPVYFVIGALIEERRLLLEYGEEYETYRKTVPFIIPGMAVLRRPPASNSRKSAL